MRTDLELARDHARAMAALTKPVTRLATSIGPGGVLVRGTIVVTPVPTDAERRAEPTTWPVRSDAVLSEDSRYRYELTRFWCDPGAFIQRAATFVMLNPSTADASVDDPTIQRCMKFARAWGLDGIRVVNLYAFRASQPSVMWEALARGVDIIGPDNEHTLRKALLRSYNECLPVTVAWGNNGAFERVRWLTRQARALHVRLQCLGTTQSGAPKHPLARGRHRIPDDFAPIPWEAPDAEH